MNIHADMAGGFCQLVSGDRAAAVEAARQIGGFRESNSAVLGAFRDRLSALSADPDGLRRLLDLLADREARARNAAAGVFREIAAVEPQGPPALPALAAEGAVRETLTRALASRQAGVREAVAGILSGTREPWALALLRRALADPSPGVRIRAARSVANLRDAEVVPALLAGLGDRLSTVRAACARALGEVGDPRALEPLTLALRDRNREVADVAAYALGALRHAGAFDALRAEARQGRHEAVRALASVPDPRVLAELLELLGDRRHDSRYGFHGTVAQALGILGDRRAAEPLVAVARDPGRAGHARGCAARALARIDDPSGRRFLEEALAGDDALGSTLAAWLEDLGGEWAERAEGYFARHPRPDPDDWRD